MTKTFTQNDVLRYLYSEMETDEEESFIKALSEDNKLASVLEKCKEKLEKLDTVLMDPPEHIIQNAIEYSATYKPI